MDGQGRTNPILETAGSGMISACEDAARPTKVDRTAADRILEWTADTDGDKRCKGKDEVTTSSNQKNAAKEMQTGCERVERRRDGETGEGEYKHAGSAGDAASTMGKSS